MVVIQILPLCRVRSSSSFFSMRFSKGSVFFRILMQGSGSGYRNCAVFSSPAFQICLHRLHRRVLRSGYTISLEQTGHVGMVRYSGNVRLLYSVIPLCVFYWRCPATCHLTGYRSLSVCPGRGGGPLHYLFLLNIPDPARAVGSHLDDKRSGKLSQDLRDVGDEEDLGEAGLLGPEGREEVCPPLLVLAAEDEEISYFFESSVLNPVIKGKIIH